MLEWIYIFLIFYLKQKFSLFKLKKLYISYNLLSIYLFLKSFNLIIYCNCH